MQFHVIVDLFCELNLDKFEQADRAEKNQGIIRDGNDMNKWKFGGLKIKKQEKEKALKGFKTL